jgi:hypothetical protein
MLFGLLARKSVFFRSLFNPRIDPAKLTSALAAEGCFWGFLLLNQPFSAAASGLSNFSPLFSIFPPPPSGPEACLSHPLLPNRPYFAQPVHLLLNVNRSKVGPRAPAETVASQAAEKLIQTVGRGFIPSSNHAKSTAPSGPESTRVFIRVSAPDSPRIPHVIRPKSRRPQSSGGASTTRFGFSPSR